MSNYQAICLYCDHKWNWSASMTVKGTMCPKCGDTTMRFKDLDKTKIDAYLGCPPFPEKLSPEEFKKDDFIYSDYAYMGGSD